MTRVGVLGLQGDVARHASLLKELGAEVIEVHEPKDLDAIEGLVLPGGESTTISLLLKANNLDKVLADKISSGMAVFGTCAGMILLSSKVLDGRSDQLCFDAIDLSVRRNGFGRQLDSFECDLELESEFFSGLSQDPIHAVFIRAPKVEVVGPKVEVLAHLDNQGERIPVVCKQGSVIVSAFHPELSGDSRLHQLFLSLL